MLTASRLRAAFFMVTVDADRVKSGIFSASEHSNVNFGALTKALCEHGVAMLADLTATAVPITCSAIDVFPAAALSTR
jgi:hypothetical protein